MPWIAKPILTYEKSNKKRKITSNVFSLAGIQVSHKYLSMTAFVEKEIKGAISLPTSLGVKQFLNLIMILTLRGCTYVVLVLNRYSIKTYGEWSWAHTSKQSQYREVSFTPWPHYLRKNSSSTQLIGDFVDAVEKRKVSCPYRKSNLDSSVVQSKI
jgi:hypothetical protein